MRRRRDLNSGSGTFRGSVSLCRCVITRRSRFRECSPICLIRLHSSQSVLRPDPDRRWSPTGSKCASDVAVLLMSRRSGLGAGPTVRPYSVKGSGGPKCACACRVTTCAASMQEPMLGVLKRAIKSHSVAIVLACVPALTTNSRRARGRMRVTTVCQAPAPRDRVTRAPAGTSRRAFGRAAGVRRRACTRLRVLWRAVPPTIGTGRSPESCSR